MDAVNHSTAAVNPDKPRTPAKVTKSAREEVTCRSWN
jgi:hypothetical protein